MQRRLGSLGYSLILLAALESAGCTEGGTPITSLKAPRNVSVSKVEEVERDETERVPGYVRAGTSPTVEAKVAGRIEKLLVKEGDIVAEGQLLATIDAHEIQAKLDHAIAQQRQAAQDLKRVSKLLPLGAVTQQDYDNVVARSRMADAAVKEASAMAGYVSIVAPFEGMVSRTFVDEGDFAQPGRPLIMLEKKAQLRFEADPAESLAGLLRIGDRLSVSVAGYPDPLSGTVDEITPTADMSSGTQRVKILLPDTPQLRSGQFGYVEIPFKKSRWITIPRAALLVRGQLETVFVAEEGHARLRLVRTGRDLQEKVQILSGLRNDERIIVSGIEGIQDGDPIAEGQ